MDNSLVTHLTGYVDALFSDIAFTYTRAREWQRDKTRLLHEMANHGERIVTLDLPALCKHLDKCLDLGLYTPSNLHLGGLARGCSTPKFLGNLYLQIFDLQGSLRPTSDINLDAVVILRQVLLGLKKLRLNCDEWRTTNEVRDFISIEAGIISPSVRWDLDLPDFLNGPRRHLGDLVLRAKQDQLDLFGESSHDDSLRGILSTCQQVADRVASSLGNFDEELPTERPKHGPGVVSNLDRGMYKYIFTEWPRKLEVQFPHDLYATPNLGEGYSRDPGMSTWSSKETPSRLIAVPKTLKGPRLIAAEPSQHQWIQQLIWNQLEGRLSKSLIRYSVCFRSQEKNQILALRGSSGGCFATIDLSSASDRLSCWLVERMFRANLTLLHRLHASRTRWLRNGIRPNLGEFIRLKKFAAMGSACTFPVQTAVYASIAVGVVLSLSGRRVTTANIHWASKQVQVFGDDIIVPVDACVTLEKVLTHLGLKINTAKTYTGKHFRESCGVDAFNGHNVSARYVIEPCSRARGSQVASVVEVSNNFHLGGYWHIAAWLREQVRYLDHTIPIVAPESNAIGFVSFCGDDLSHLRKRWNRHLHRDEYRISMFTTKRSVRDSDGSAQLLQYFTENPDPTVMWKSGVTDRKVSTVRPGWYPPYSFSRWSDPNRDGGYRRVRVSA